VTAVAPLRRTRQDRLVAGVLGGMARHFDLDPTLLRVVYVIATICTAFVGVVIYLMAWIVIPEEAGGDATR
jgi:phage shock protein PspC (stress-responsive transcriptional regulator)